MTNLGSNMTIKRSITSKMTNLGSNMTDKVSHTAILNLINFHVIFSKYIN